MVVSWVVVGLVVVGWVVVGWVVVCWVVVGWVAFRCVVVGWVVVSWVVVGTENLLGHLCNLVLTQTFEKWRRNTPRTRGWSRLCDQTLAVKSSQNTRKSFFLS